MSDRGISRLVRAARRAVPSLLIAGSATNTAFLAWLTTKAAAEAAPKDAPDSNGEKSDTTAAVPQVTKSGAGTESGSTTSSEEGSGAANANSAAGHADADNARGDAATNGMANGNAQDNGGVAGSAKGTSVG